VRKTKGYKTTKELNKTYKISLIPSKRQVRKKTSWSSTKLSKIY